MLKNILSLFLTFYGLIFYYIFRKTPNFFYQSYIKAYCFTRGLSQKIIFDFFKIFTYRKKIDENDFKTIFNQEYNFNKINDKINKDGYYVFEEKLNTNLVDSLMQFSLNTKCSFYDKDKKKHFDYYDKKIVDHITTKYDYDENVLYNNKIIKTLLLDKVFLKIANNFFGTKPLYSAINMWWSPAVKKKINLETELANQTAQLFHFDLDRIKWLKFFIYLTDTFEDDGPHQYVEGTHKIFAKNSEITKLGYQRIDSNLIAKHYPNKLKKITGKKGTIFVGDTSAIHRGVPPLINDRLVLVIEYANSLYGAEYKKIKSNTHHENSSKYNFLIKEKIIND
jgi:hypothetical protein